MKFAGQGNVGDLAWAARFTHACPDFRAFSLQKMNDRWSLPEETFDSHAFTHSTAIHSRRYRQVSLALFLLQMHPASRSSRFYTAVQFRSFSLKKRMPYFHCRAARFSHACSGFSRNIFLKK